MMPLSCTTGKTEELIKWSRNQVLTGCDHGNQSLFTSIQSLDTLQYKQLVDSIITAVDTMESELLRKEEEYHKENEKLEIRTRELMQKVNEAMKIQDNLIKDSLKTKADINNARKTNFKFNDRSEKLESTEEYNEIDNMGVQGANQYYKAKVKALQVENIKLQAENKKKIDELKKVQNEKTSIQEEKEKWFMAYNSSKVSIGKLESQISELNSGLQNKSCEITSIKKELEQVKKDLKNSNLKSNNFEARLLRAQEENEKLKVSMKNVKDEDKELKESFKKQINDLIGTVKLIERHKIELLNGFKKQLQLIDNLKKQKMYLETLKIAEVAESEYHKILECKLD